MRLVDGNTEGEGRVEVFHAGQWGTVCDDHWSEIDANIVCKELGFARAIAAAGFSTFGEGSGRVSRLSDFCSPSLPPSIPPSLTPLSAAPYLPDLAR